MFKHCSYMQGTPAFIETHYESLHYYHQDKEVCYYCKNMLCRNEKSVLYCKKCIGYTKCSDFISPETYRLKKVKENKKKNSLGKYYSKQSYIDGNKQNVQNNNKLVNEGKSKP